MDNLLDGVGNRSTPAHIVEHSYTCALLNGLLGGRSTLDTQEGRFNEVLCMLEHERERFDADLRRLTVAAAYLRALLLPERRPHARRRRCTPRRRPVA